MEENLAVQGGKREEEKELKKLRKGGEERVNQGRRREVIKRNEKK